MSTVTSKKPFHIFQGLIWKRCTVHGPVSLNSDRRREQWEQWELAWNRSFMYLGQSDKPKDPKPDSCVGYLPNLLDLCWIPPDLVDCLLALSGPSSQRCFDQGIHDTNIGSCSYFSHPTVTVQRFSVQGLSRVWHTDVWRETLELPMCFLYRCSDAAELQTEQLTGQRKLQPLVSPAV